MTIKELSNTIFHYFFEQDNEFGSTEIGITIEPSGKSELIVGVPQNDGSLTQQSSSFGQFSDDDIQKFETYRDVGLWLLKLYGGLTDEKTKSTNGQVVLVVSWPEDRTITYIYKEGIDF